MDVINLGHMPYEQAWEYQKQLLARRIAGEIGDTLVWVEHPPVFTVGRAWHGDRLGLGQTINVPGRGAVSVLEVERGGKLTFHGPGQLVGYPIFQISRHDLRAFLRALETSIIAAIWDVTALSATPEPSGLTPEPGQLLTGVWIQNRKVASIGIAVRHWVSYHGFAVNISTDLDYFRAVHPCGFSGDVMTSLSAELEARGREQNHIPKSSASIWAELEGVIADKLGSLLT